MAGKKINLEEFMNTKERLEKTEEKSEERFQE